MPVRSRFASEQFWNDAARRNAPWFVATGYTRADTAFFAQGARETDELLALCEVRIRPEDTVLEIGCGLGRMTHRLAHLANRVIAVDISQEMLERAARNLADQHAIEYVRVPGDGTLPFPDASVDVVFSYITLQHVPSVAAQLRYLRESLRVLRPGGSLAAQVRADGLTARMCDWTGHLAHFALGRPTMHPAWRGARPRTAELQAVADDIQIRRFHRRHAWVVARVRALSPR
jgi:ubiquinone/menaquinone biosynthesis C-methylase UbiE